MALNHYSGCTHSCRYCFAPTFTHRERNDFHINVSSRVGIHDITKGAAEWKGEKKPVQLCFVTDPYQPLDAELKLTRHAIHILNQYGFPVHILTKAGKLAQRDFDLLAAFPGNAFATTLTCSTDGLSALWEPRAATGPERIANLKAAHAAGIATWVSLEPVINPEQTLELIEMAAQYTGHFKVGTLNYHSRAKEIDWPQFARDVIDRLDSVGARYYIKADLAVHLGRTAGYWSDTDE